MKTDARRLFRSVRLVLVGVLSMLGAARAVDVLPEELVEARRWARAKFEGVEDLQGIETGLNVMTGYCPIGQNRQGELPLKLGDKVYPRGLFCHAPTKVRVRLPRPGKSFTALVGLGTNHMTAPGRGSIVGSVSVAGAEKFRSGVLREGMVQVFCRAGTIYESARLHLRGLDAGAEYSLTDLDTGRARKLGGKEMMEGGLVITATARPSAPVLIYKKIR